MIRVSGSKVPIATERRDLRGYAASRKRYDQARRRLIEDINDREAFRAYAKLVRRDPCGACGGRVDVAADHIEPLRGRGTNTWDNLGALCRSCNAKKRNKTLLMFLSGQAGKV